MSEKTARWVVNSVDPDQMLQNAASDQDLHCLLGSLVPIFVIMVAVLSGFKL